MKQKGVYGLAGHHDGRIDTPDEVDNFLKGFKEDDVLKHVLSLYATISYVNQSISTATADFKGTFETIEEMEAVTGNRNDYANLITEDEYGNTIYNRYKWVVDTGWVFEWAFNQDNFSSAQWDAINSGITSALLTTISTGAAAGATAYQLPEGGVPENDLSSTVKTKLNAFDANTQNTMSAIMALAVDPNTATVSVTTNPEWKLVYTDDDDKVLFGKRQDDSWYFPDNFDTLANDILDAAIAGYTTT